MRARFSLSARVPFAGVIACGTSLLLTLTSCTNTLNRAIYREHPDLIKKFLAEGADVNQANDDGGTPLIYAAQHSDLSLIKTLVERGAKVNWTDKTGNSALGYLTSGKTYKNDAVSFLLGHGAEVNKANNAGITPLHFAAARTCEPTDTTRQLELVTLLLGAGADPNLYTERGDLALHLAAAANQPDSLLEQLLNVTKDPQRLNQAGYSAFSSAARTGAGACLFFGRARLLAPRTRSCRSAG